MSVSIAKASPFHLFLRLSLYGDDPGEGEVLSEGKNTFSIPTGHQATLSSRRRESKSKEFFPNSQSPSTFPYRPMKRVPPDGLPRIPTAREFIGNKPPL